MPILVDPCRPAGFLRELQQPRLDVDDQLSLRPWRESDAPVVRAAFDNPEIQRWHARRLDSLDEAHDWVAMWATRWINETDASWAIVRDDQPVGQVGLRVISLLEGLAHVSYWVLPAARGAGVAVRAALALTRWSFDVLGLHRVSLEHSTANVASCRVATKLGFALEGTLRGSALHTDGWHDMHVHSRLRTD
ncbi:MAG TPA: GNAT family N-acetyltransferase [Pseudonocardiaceae bacterium]